MFGSDDFGRVGVAGQRDRLANGRNRATDCAIFNLVSIAIVACADSCSKLGKQADTLGEAGVLKVRVHSHRTFASGSNIFAGRGKLPPIVQRKRRHPQDRNHAHSYCGGGLAKRPQVLVWERKGGVEES